MLFSSFVTRCCNLLIAPPLCGLDQFHYARYALIVPVWVLLRLGCHLGACGRVRKDTLPLLKTFGDLYGSSLSSLRAWLGVFEPLNPDV